MGVALVSRVIVLCAVSKRSGSNRFLCSLYTKGTDVYGTPYHSRARVALSFSIFYTFITLFPCLDMLSSVLTISLAFGASVGETVIHLPV